MPPDARADGVTAVAAYLEAVGRLAAELVARGDVALAEDFLVQAGWMTASVSRTGRDRCPIPSATSDDTPPSLRRGASEPAYPRSSAAEVDDGQGPDVQLPCVVEAEKDGYTFGMKTAISLPDAVFEQADRLARQLGKSRSELYREAVAEYVARHDPEAITEAMNRVAEQVDIRPDAFSAAAGRALLDRSEW
jgi:hypothetical protein